MLPPRALLPRNTFIGSNQRRSHLGSAHSHAIQLITEARALIDQLRPIAAEQSALGAVIGQVRMQVHAKAGITPATRPRTRTEVSVVELVELIEADQHPLDPWT